MKYSFSLTVLFVLPFTFLSAEIPKTIFKCFALGVICASSGCSKFPPKKAVIKLDSMIPSNKYNECVGSSKNGNTIYFAANGKDLYSLDINNPEAKLVVTIAEVTKTWNDDYGDTFLHDFKYANDGTLYAVAEDRILVIDPVNGSYQTIVEGGFSGPWGAYGLTLDKSGNLFVGDHAGGVYFYSKSNNWEKHIVINPADTPKGKLASFGGVVLDRDDKLLYVLDFENSLLYSSELNWNNEGVPSIKNLNSLQLPLTYPEFMQLWNGDVFIKAARDNSMVRVRNNKVIQTIGFESNEPLSPIVTFVLDPQDEETAIFYGTSWGPDGTLFRGELIFH
jgi:hypothetical protein